MLTVYGGVPNDVPENPTGGQTFQWSPRKLQPLITYLPVDAYSDDSGQ